MRLQLFVAAQRLRDEVSQVFKRVDMAFSDVHDAALPGDETFRPPTFAMADVLFSSAKTELELAAKFVAPSLDAPNV